MLHITLDTSAKAFERQLEKLSNLVDIELCESGLLLSCAAGSDGLTVEKGDGEAKITYEKKCEFFRGILTLMEHADEEELLIHEKASFDFNGEMIDNSRNAVINMKTAKEMIMYSALLGMDNIMLYNEETFEVPEEPYFGYMRMGYTRENVRDLNEFGRDFGVTIIPCIQTLAHLNQFIRWRGNAGITDCADILLVEEEKTYALIENIIKSWRDCVDTDIINIGMDEAHMLGRGQYQDKHGFKPRFEIMVDHLNRVLEICRKYGFKKIMMWSDMFFRIVFGDYYAEGEIDQELLKLVPSDVMLVYWDYYSTEQSKYDRLFKQHLRFNNEIGFAGGSWKWSGYAPSIDHSHRVTKLALQAARDNGVSTVFTTAWGDNGADASIFTILANLCLFSQMSYSDENVDEEVSAKLKALTGYTLEEYCALCEPNHTPTGNLVPHVNAPYYLFFQDPLMGLFDYHVREDYPAYFAQCAERLHGLADRDSKVSYLFDVLAKYCDVLEMKCDLGVRMKAAYETNDFDTLENIAHYEIGEILERIDRFYYALRGQWYRENRPGGFDVQDLRIGGLKQRMLTAYDTLESFLHGNSDVILELEQPRLPFDCREPGAGGDLNTDEHRWRFVSSPNVND